MSRALFFLSGFAANGAVTVAGILPVGIGEPVRASLLVCVAFLIGILANGFYRREREQ